MKNIILISFLNMLFFLFGYNSAISQELNYEVNFNKHKCLPGYSLKKLKNPEMFQGNKKRKHYFEGWYFKMVSADKASIISVIPGISLSKNGKEQHAFIQIIDGKTANTFYYTFSIEAFSFSKKQFAIRIGNNYFSEDSIVLDIQNDTISIKGKVNMTEQVKLTRNNKKMNIMGWFKYVPFMQCYHGVVSLNHKLQGTIKKGNVIYNFDNGLGYIEKDWGKSMPTSWIWIQSNNFSSERSSFMLSVANVPWMGSSFTGFLGFFLHDNIIERFGTYSHSKIKLESSISDTVKIIISDKKFNYHLKAFHNKAGILKAPVNGTMDRRIAESIDATLELNVADKNGNFVFQDISLVTGLEIVGDLKELSKNVKKVKPVERN